MPELPEVETVRRDLAPLLVGRTITRVEQRLEDPHYQDLARAAGRSIRELRRRGKYLLADLGELELLGHLGMSGRMGVVRALPPELRHLRVVFHLDDGAAWYLNDPRRFGRLAVVITGDYAGHPTLAHMGPEPLGEDFRVGDFVRAMARPRPVKALLLDQQVVAGLGNIYVDEACFRAGVHPARRGLPAATARRLYRVIRELLALAVAHRGTTFRDFRDGQGAHGAYQELLQVYERAGQPCGRCGTPIVKTVLVGRGTHHCPGCQRGS